MQEVFAVADCIPERAEFEACTRHGYIDDCGTGNTTRLFEHAIELLGELDENEWVVITGAHTPWLFELEHRFKASGLVGVKFMNVDAIMQGKLRGFRGILLIDDPWDLTAKQNDIIYMEAQLMRIKPMTVRE